MTTPVFYDISSVSLLQKYLDLSDIKPGSADADLTSNYEIARDNAVNELVTRVGSGEIWFPYQRYFRNSPDMLFETIKIIDLPVITGPYRLHSYYPQYGTYMPPKFRGTPLVISGSRDTYKSADVLSDHYIEHIRLKAKRYDQVRSIIECWENDSCLKEIMKVALNKPKITPETLRNTIYETIPETRVFNPTWARALLKLVMGPDLSGKRWLDISAGWGDRLIAAMSLDMDYLGFDPNIELKLGHTEMINKFGNNKRHKVIYEPFEKSTIPDGPYDVVLSSPPYFTIEEYAPNQQGQSIISYPDFNQWMVWFLFVSLTKAWNNLKDNGYLILHLGDARTIKTSEAANIFIENNLPGASWEGVIGLQNKAGFPRPIWVWKKLKASDARIVWEPQNKRTYDSHQRGPLRSAQRTLYNTYPYLQAELVNYYASKHAPNYIIRKSNASSIRDHVELILVGEFPSLPPAPGSPPVILGVKQSKLKHCLTIGDIDVTHSSPEQSFNIMTPRNPTQTSTILNENIICDPSIISLDLSHDTCVKITRDDIDKILYDDLMISSLLEILGVEDTIKWAVNMIKLSFYRSYV